MALGKKPPPARKDARTSGHTSSAADPNAGSFGQSKGEGWGNNKESKKGFPMQM